METVVAPAEPKAAPVEAPKVVEKAAPEKPAAEGEAAPKTETRTYTQEEMDKITAKVKKNERYRTRKEVEAFYQGRESAAPKPAEKPAVVEDKPPTRDQYDSYESFLEAKAEYTGRKAATEYRQKAEKEAKEQQAREAQEERVKTFQTKVNEKYPDLADRLEAIGEVIMPPGMVEAISESELGPDILNHFAGNPKDFERIVALSPSAAIREIGKLEARLEGAAKPEPVVEVKEVKKPSSAPTPIKPVGGNAVAGGDQLAALVDKPDEWRRVRDREVAAKRKGASK